MNGQKKEERSSKEEERLNVLIPKGLKQEMQILAVNEGRSLKTLVIEALENLLEKRGENNLIIV